MTKYHGQFFERIEQDEAFYKESFEFEGIKYDVYFSSLLWLYYGDNNHRDYFYFSKNGAHSLGDIEPSENLMTLLRLKGYNI